MQTLKKIVALMSVIVVGCATPYGQKGITGGYVDKKIDETHYQVEFHGNGFASKDRIWYFWIYRCAELTKEKGFAYFSIQSFPSGKTGFNDERADPRLVSAGGSSSVYFMKTAGTSYIYIPGQTITTWHSRAIIAMFNDPLLGGVGSVFRAQSILDDLNFYVKSDGKEAPMDREKLLRRALNTPKV